MSLILDALKQSEKDRQQQAESIADTLYIQVKPERRSFWPIVLVLLLLANIAILLFLWWRTPAESTAPTAADPRDIIESARHAAPAPAEPPAPNTASRILRPLAQELGATRVIEAQRPAPRRQPAPPAADKAVPAATAAATIQARAADGDTLEKLQQYEINTIVYSDTPSRRYALINMQKFKEGATLPHSKLRIREITNDGLIIDTGAGLVRYSGTP